jgi:hypothetical protein
MFDACALFILPAGDSQLLIVERCFMSVHNFALAMVVGFGVTAALVPPAISGQKTDLKTPGAGIEALGGNKLLKAGDAKIKIKPGERGDCVRIKAGNAKVGKGKMKNGECKS